MTEGEFPNRDFTMRPEGYDPSEVDSLVGDLQSEILELRRDKDSGGAGGGSADARLHDPEGAVTRTLAIAQETADRVLHDAQVEADRRQSEADEHSTTVIADADERAARLLADMEAQAAEVREQGVAAARSAIQVERDKAMAELSHVRRVRDDLRTEALELKSSLDRYRSQAREASDTLAAASSGPLMSLDLPDFVDDDVVLAGIAPASVDGDDLAMDTNVTYDDDSDAGIDNDAALRSVDAADDAEDDAEDSGGYSSDDEVQFMDDLPDNDTDGDDELADVIAIGSDDVGDDAEIELTGGESGTGDDFGGTFLSEVRAAAEDDDAVDADDGSDEFLSELRTIADDTDTDDAFDSEAADTFFDSE